MPMNGLAEHTCSVLGQKIWIPIGLVPYAATVIVSAKCRFCGQAQFEKSIDRSHAASKGSYVTV